MNWEGCFNILAQAPLCFSLCRNWFLDKRALGVLSRFRAVRRVAVPVRLGGGVVLAVGTGASRVPPPPSFAVVRVGAELARVVLWFRGVLKTS